MYKIYYFGQVIDIQKISKRIHENFHFFFYQLHFLNFSSEILLHFISSRINVSVCLNLLLSSARGLSFQPHHLMLLKTKTLLRKPVKMKKRWNCELCPNKGGKSKGWGIPIFCLSISS